MNLFQRAWFQLHSGQSSEWKIDCDALTDDDMIGLASMLSEILPPFGRVEGVPTGGLRLADTMLRYRSDGPLLIVDDVLTTGASMEAHRHDRQAIGAVIFARGRCPWWVIPLFQMTIGKQVMI
jgi:orotate phosphoribosyltransferase